MAATRHRNMNTGPNKHPINGAFSSTARVVMVPRMPLMSRLGGSAISRSVFVGWLESRSRVDREQPPCQCVLDALESGYAV
jgi:hypothetical protein